MTATLSIRFPLEEREERHELPAGKNIAEALMEISPDRWGGMNFELYEGAVTSGGLRAVDSAIDREVQDGELWIVIVVPGEAFTAAALITSLATYLGGTALATVAATVIVYTAMAAISMAISFAVSLLLRPGKQTDRAPAAADTPTSLNSLQAPRNTMRPLSRIPDIYGAMRHWPDLIMPGLASWSIVNATGGEHEFIENRLTTSDQFVETVYCLGRGTYTIDRPQFGDSSVASQNGTVSIYQPGRELPASIKMGWGVPNISRVELGDFGASNMWTPWFEIPANNVSEIWAQVAFPSGIISVIGGKKVQAPYNKQTLQVNLTIEGERLNDAGVVVETGSWTTVIAVKTTNELRNTFKVTGITPGRWRVRVADTWPTQPLFPNGNTREDFKQAFLEGITGLEVLDADDRTFENETIVVVTATNRAGSAAQNLEVFNAIVQRVLPTQDFNSAPGVFLPPSSNRLWITAAIHTLTDPTLCAYSHTEVDWASLVEVHNSLASYPVGFSEIEFNGIFDRQMSADEQLVMIARKARAMPFVSNGRLTMARDERRTGVSAIFNRRNRMLDRGSLGIGLRFPGPDENDGVEISWIDENDSYRQKTYSFPEGVTLFNPLSIDMVGATKAYEVCRRARFEYYANIYRRRTQPLRVTEEGQLLMPFDRVGIVAPWEEGVIDGEVLEIDGSDLRLDRPVPDPLPGSARIRLRSPDGRETSLHELVANPGLGSQWVTLTTLPSYSLIVPGTGEQLGTLYNLSMTDAIESASHWLMTGAEIDDRGVVLTLMEDNDLVYQFSDDVSDPCAGSTPPLCVPLNVDLNIEDPYWSVAGGTDGGTGYWVNSSAGFRSFTMAHSLSGITYAVTNPAPGEVHIEFTKTGSADVLLYPMVFMPGVPIEIVANGQPNGQLSMDATVEIVTPGADGDFTTFCSLYAWTSIGSGPPPMPPADIPDYEDSALLDLGGSDTSFFAPVATLVHTYDGTTLSGTYDFDGSGPTPIVGPTYSYVAGGPWSPRTPSVGETIYVFPFIEFGVGWNPASDPGAVVRLKLTNFRYDLQCIE